MNEMTKIAAATPETARDYFVRREAQERALAERSTDPVARRVHAELAERYAALIGTPA